MLQKRLHSPVQKKTSDALTGVQMDKKGKDFGDTLEVIFCSAKVAKVTAAKRKYCFDLVTAKRTYLIATPTVPPPSFQREHDYQV